MRTFAGMTSRQFRGARFPKRRTRGPKEMPKRVRQRRLKRLVRKGQCLRTGVTQNPGRRFGEYRRDHKYKNTEMLYSRTRNIMQTEDNLLSYGKCRYNQQRLSNAQPEPGYAYVIRKRRPCNKPRRGVAGGRILKQMFNFLLSPWITPWW